MQLAQSLSDDEVSGGVCHTLFCGESFFYSHNHSNRPSRECYYHLGNNSTSIREFRDELRQEHLGDTPNVEIDFNTFIDTWDVFN